MFIVFEVMETDLHQVIKANDDLTDEHYRFFSISCCEGSSICTAPRCFVET